MILEVILPVLNFALYLLFALFLIPTAVNLLTAFSSLKQELEYKDFFPTVSVIVRTWNDGGVIERCIQGYVNQNYPKKLYELIIIDDGSTDNTQKICNNYAKQGKIKYIRFPKHETYKAKLIDYAINNYALGEIIVETDVDGVIKENFLSTIVKPYSKKEVMATTGIVMCGNWQQNFLTKIRAIEDFWFFCITMYGRFRLGGQGFLYGGCKSYRKKAWEAVGGHNTKTLVEDAELAAKFIEKGYKIAIVKDSPVLQEEVATTEQYFSEQRRWIGGDLDFASKYKYEMSKNLLNKFLMYINFSTDAIYLISIILSFVQPLFLIPIIVHLLSLWIGMWGFNAKPIFYLYSIPYIIAGPILRFAVIFDIYFMKLGGKKPQWTKVWHSPIELISPTK